MAPKAAPKAAKKPVVPLEEPADKRVAPDLSSVLSELLSSDAETQQQGLSRLLGIREYAGAKKAVSKQGVVDALVSLVASQNVETQVLSVRCLARFAAWTDSPRHAYCTADVAESVWRAGLDETSPKTLSKEFLEGCLRCMGTICSSSFVISEQLAQHKMTSLAAALQHSSPKVQERACRLVAALAIYTPSRAAVLSCCVKPLLDLCNAAVPAPVMHQACWALTQLTQPVGSCNAATQLLELDASAVLLELLKGAAVADERTAAGLECAATLFCTLLRKRPTLAVTMTDAHGVETLLDLLPTPYIDPVEAAAQAAAQAAAAQAAAQAAVAAAAAANPPPLVGATSRPAAAFAASLKKAEAAALAALPPPVVIDYSIKPKSASLQTALLQVLAAVLESGEARKRLALNQKPSSDAQIAAAALAPPVSSTSSSSQAGAALVPLVLNLLCLETPEIAEAPAANTAGTGKGKADAKGKPSAKGKPEAQATASAPFTEVLPPFPAVVQLAAMECLKELAKEPVIVTQLLQSTFLQRVANLLGAASEQTAEQWAVLLQSMALNCLPEELPIADIKPVMRMLASMTVKSDNHYLQAAVGSLACSLPPATLLPDVRPPLPTPPATPPPPPLPVSKFIWEAMDYSHPVIPTVT